MLRTYKAKRLNWPSTLPTVLPVNASCFICFSFPVAFPAQCFCWCILCRMEMREVVTHNNRAFLHSPVISLSCQLKTNKGRRSCDETEHHYHTLVHYSGHIQMLFHPQTCWTVKTAEFEQGCPNKEANSSPQLNVIGTLPPKKMTLYSIQY